MLQRTAAQCRSGILARSRPTCCPRGRFAGELAVRESGREAASPSRMLVVRELATISEITQVAFGGWRRLMHKLCRISANLSVRIDLVRAGTGRFPASEAETRRVFGPVSGLPCGAGPTH